MVINFGHMVDSETCHFIDEQYLNGYNTPQSFLALRFQWQQPCH